MERVPGKTPDNNESAAVRSNHERNNLPHFEKEGGQVSYPENTPQGKLIQMLQAPSAGQSQTPQGKLIQKLEAPVPDQEEFAPEEDTLQKKSSGEGPASPPSEGGGTGSSLPKTVRSEMENAFSSDFSGVRIHTESIKSLNVGALAFTQGNHIHFSPGQYRPESQKGKELLGHELAHVQQQREGRVRPTTQAKGLPVNDDPALEKEADEMGAKAAKGEVVQGKSTAPAQLPETAALQKKEGEENSHRFDIMKYETHLYETPSPQGKVITTLEKGKRVFLLETQGTWQKVQTEDGKTGFVGAYRVNGNMPDPNAKLHRIKKRDRLENIVKTNYSNFVKGRDMRDYARAIMHVNNPTNNKNKGIYKDGTFSLRHAYSEYNQYVLKEGLEIWIPGQGFADTLLNRFDNTSSATHDLAQGAKENLVAPMANMVDRYWPKGWGLSLEGGLGLTFGIPVGADLQATTHFYRKDEDTIALRKSTDVRAGLDTGVSAGFYLGSKGGGGIGGEAGADAEVKGGLFSLLEYEFPFKEDLSIISLMIALKGAGSPMMMISSFLDMFFSIGLSPMQYLTKSKQSIGVKASAEALAQAGVRKDEAGRGRYAERYGRDESMADDAAGTYGGIKGMLLRRLEQKLGGGIFANANVGVELEVQESTKNRRTGMREPSKAQADIFIEGDVAANLQIPFLTGVNLGAGVGAKLGYYYENGKWSNKPKVRFYTYQGEMDLYQGPASETEVSLENTDVRNWKLDELVSYFHGLKIKRRYALPMNIFGRYTALLAKQEGVKRIMKREYSQKGAYMENYLTLDFDLEKADVKKLMLILQRLYGNFKGKGIGGIIAEFQKFLETGQTKGAFNDLINLLFSKNALINAELHSKVGYGIAFGVKGSYGAKARVDANVGGALTHTSEARDAVLKVMQSEDKLAFFRQLAGAKPTPEPLN